MALSVTSAPWQQVNMPALDLRRALSSGAHEGVLAPATMLVAQRAAGANMSVDISAGEAYIQGDTITAQGLYYAYNDALVNLTGFSAANVTNPRIDRVALRVRDAFHGDAANDLAFVVLTGTATSGATLTNLSGAPTVPGSHLLLANVLIPANATTITTANIDTSDAVRVTASRQLAIPILSSPRQAGLVLTSATITIAGSFHRITSTSGGTNLTTINTSIGSVDGLRLILLNKTGAPMTMDSSSNIVTPSGGTITLANNRCAELFYSGADTTYYVLSFA